MAVIDLGPNNFTITVSGTTASPHAPVEPQIAGHIINYAIPQEWVSRLTEGTLVALSEAQEQTTRLTVGAVAVLSESQEQTTRLTIGVLVDLTAPHLTPSQALLGSF